MKPTGHDIIEAAFVKAQKIDPSNSPAPLSGEAAVAYQQGLVAAYLHCLEMIPASVSVERILLAVTPGEDGMGHEVYAKSAEDVENVLSKMGERLEDFELARPSHARGEVLVTVSGFTGCGKSAVAGEIEILCKALGLQVEWSNGQSEKNMTHADWTVALEEYKPRVRIVEKNIA